MGGSEVEPQSAAEQLGQRVEGALPVVGRRSALEPMVWIRRELGADRVE